MLGCEHCYYVNGTHSSVQGKLEARTICRNLLRRGLVVTVMKDIGRQRVTNFVARRFEAVSAGAVQYQVTNCVVYCVL